MEGNWGRERRTEDRKEKTGKTEKVIDILTPETGTNKRRQIPNLTSSSNKSSSYLSPCTYKFISFLYSHSGSNLQIQTEHLAVVADVTFATLTLVHVGRPQIVFTRPAVRTRMASTLVVICGQPVCIGERNRRFGISFYFKIKNIF